MKPNSNTQYGRCGPSARHRRVGYVTLLCLTVVVAAACLAPAAQRLRRARRQAKAVAELRSLGAKVLYDYQLVLGNEGKIITDVPDDAFVKRGVVRSKRPWLDQFFGIDFFHDVLFVSIESDAVREQDLRCLFGLKDLQLVCYRAPRVTGEFTLKLKEVLPDCEVIHIVSVVGLD